MVGSTLGHYEILEPLGAGGMGEVYRPRDTNLDRDVAIKVWGFLRIVSQWAGRLRLKLNWFEELERLVLTDGSR